ncbi:hypothetical protein Tco_0839581 [Tanacetum coccineum]|uniref:Uncharacterized protein n=1 Tax=Tanacetum coccineum TaxID=301880 RepID=A0ABQ5ASW3_9ASTR
MDVNWTSKDMKKVDVWDSLTKNFIRSFKMYVQYWLVLFLRYACSGNRSVQYYFEKTDPESIVLAAFMMVLFFLSPTPFCSEALAKKQDSCAEDVMSRTYTSLTLGAIITTSLLELKIVPLFSSN